MSDVEKRETKELLLAIRMRWLGWLSKPIQFIWHVIVEVALTLWNMIKQSAMVLKHGYNRKVLFRAAVGGTVFFALYFLFNYFAILTNTPILATVGIVLGIIPLAWT